MIYLLCVQMRNVCIKRGSTTVERNLQTPDADPVHRRSSDRAAQNSWEDRARVEDLRALQISTIPSFPPTLSALLAL